LKSSLSNIFAFRNKFAFKMRMLLPLLTHIMQLNIDFPLHLVLRAGRDLLCSMISQNAVFRL
jgi:hypothetical protein